ncbi:MAG: hypothetical protein ABSB63_01585 [Spirochaetia bacterium]
MQMILETVMTILSLVEKFIPVISLALILLTYLTLREVSRQRRETYRPRLFVGKQMYYVQKNPNGTPCFLKNENKKLNDLHAKPYELELANIGLGAAHTIRLSWKYDKSKIIKDLSELGRQSGRLHNVSDGHFQYMFNVNDAEHGYRFRIARPSEINSEIPFLKSGNSIRFALPDTVRHILTFFPYLKLLTLEFPHRIDIANRDVSIQVVYLDISGQEHRQMFQLVVTGSAYGKEDQNGNYGSGALMFQMQREKDD